MSTSEESSRLKREERKNDFSDKYTHYRAEENNPCLKEQNLSFKCLDDNNYDKEACTAYFLNYRNCKEFWYKVRKERRAKGIRPYLPPPEERQKIKAETFRAS